MACWRGCSLSTGLDEQTKLENNISEHTSFRMLKKPRTVVGCVVEDDVRKAEQSVLLSRHLQNLLQLCLATVLTEILLVYEHRGLIDELVADTVRTVTLATLLERSPVDHVSPRTTLRELLIPAGCRAHPLRDEGQD